MPPLQYNQLTSLSAVKSIGLASTSDVVAPSGAYAVLLQAETQNVRFRLDGTSPTTAVGMRLIAGDAPIRLDGAEAVRSIKVIEEAASAKLNIHFVTM